MAALVDAARLLGLAALLLSFAILATRHMQPLAYAAQGVALILAALCQGALQADWTLAAVAVVLAVQGVLLWFNRPALSDPPGFPIVVLCGALLLVVLATATAPSDGMAIPLAIVLLGLLGIAAMPGPYGVLSLLNGVVLAMLIAPGLPLRLVMVVALAVLAQWIVRDDGQLAWWRR